MVGALPKELARRGLDVRVVMPLYQGMRWDDFEMLEGTLAVPMGIGRHAPRCGRATCRARTCASTSSSTAATSTGRSSTARRREAYGDNLERFAFLSRAALELCTALDWIPDVVHAHDWQTALVPVYLEPSSGRSRCTARASVLTIHNLAYPGRFEPRELLPSPGSARALPPDAGSSTSARSTS